MAAKHQLLRWSINQAAAEFGLTHQTLTKRLRQSSSVPGADGRYSTRQILAAVFNDVNSERIRLYREQADKLAFENAKARAEQIDAGEVYKAYEGIFAAMRTTVLASKLTNAEKGEIMGNLRHDVAVNSAPIE
jgi:phage terminase Nu1 subunit (DNA packaging protein)